MTTISLSEREYRDLTDTIHRLSSQLARLRQNARIANPRPIKKSVADRLHGILTLPEDIDYREVLADELLKKHIIPKRPVSR